MKRQNHLTLGDSPIQFGNVIRDLNVDDYMSDAKQWNVPQIIEEELFEDWLEYQGIQRRGKK